MKTIFRRSFFYLILIYSLLILGVSMDILWKYSFKLDIFAIIIAVLGIFALGREKELKFSEKLITVLFLSGLIFAIFLRTLPYIDNSVPLGYDPGIYKYVFEKFQSSLPGIPEQSLDKWIVSGFPSGLAVLTDIFYLLGLSSDQIIIPIYILIASFTIFPIYLVSKKYFGKEAGVFSALLFSFSLTQLNVFWYFYYKNIIAMSFMLFALYFMDNKKFLIPTIIFAAATGFFHQPTFLILAAVWMAFTLVNFRNMELLKNGILGIACTGILLLIIYSQRLSELVIQPMESVFGSVITPGTIGAGTFYNLFTYQYVSLVYLPLALLGFFFLIKTRDFNPVFLWFLINGIIVVFKLLFYNRLIINLDIAGILLAGCGLAYGILYSQNLSKNIKMGVIIIILLTGAISVLKLSSDMRPLISEMQLESVKKIQNFTENNSLVMATTSSYSPWVIGYSNRTTIAPGLFDYDKWSKDDWIKFWSAGSAAEINPLMDVYDKPLYVFIGKHPSSSIINPQKFSDACFIKAFEDDGGILYKYDC